MTKDVLTIDSECSVLEACEIYSKHNVGCLVVKDKGIVVGIITERDIIQYIIISNGNPKDTKVKEIMSPKLKTIHDSSSVDKAVKIMKDNNIKRLPVVKNNDIVGIITETDLSRAILDFSKIIDNLNRLYEESREDIDNILDGWGKAMVKLQDFKSNKKDKKIMTSEEINI